jgi:hypothetical protein
MWWAMALGGELAHFVCDFFFDLQGQGLAV